MKIIIKNLQNRIPIDPKTAKLAILKVFLVEDAKLSGEITLCFVNDKKIKELNLKYRNINRPTDVLTFDLREKGHLNILADIVISTDRAVANARIFKTSPLFELYLYIIHGVLHLLGYNDKSKKERLIMQKKEKYLLKALKLSPKTYHQ